MPSKHAHPLRSPGGDVTFVTGGGRGIGAAICRRLAHSGHDLVVGYRSRTDDAAQIVREVESYGVRAVAVQVDTTDPDSVATAFAAVAEFGILTGLVNNAGAVSAIGPLAELDPEQIRRDIEVNLYGVLLCSQAGIHAMRDSGGAIVNISSSAATLGSPGMYVHYAASKAGVDAMTVGLAKELAPAGIRVNGVAPGIIWTDFHRDPQRPAKLADVIPMGRSAVPDEIAGAVAWLLSEDAGYATGTTIRVAGGL